MYKILLAKVKASVSFLLRDLAMQESSAVMRPGRHLFRSPFPLSAPPLGTRASYPLYGM